MNVRALDYYAELVRVGRLGGLRREDAEEVAQDALLLLHLKSETAEIRILPDDRVENRAGRTRSLRAWLRDTVGYLLRNRIRTELRRRFLSFPLDAVAWDEATALVERERDVLEFGRFVFSLLDEEEARLLRWHVMGLKSHEIGARLGTCPATVRVRLMRLLDRLRRDGRVLQRADGLGMRPAEARERGATDGSRGDRGDGPGPASGGGGPASSDGTGPRDANDSGCTDGKEHGGQTGDAIDDEPSHDDGWGPADPLESLLGEYGTVCRRRGIDPWPSASGGAPAPRPGRVPRSGSGLRPRARLARLAPAGAVALVLWWLGPRDPWPFAPPLERRFGTASKVSSSGVEEQGERARSTTREGRRGSAPSTVGGIRGIVSVALLPDLPPAIEVLRGEALEDATGEPAPLAAGGGILLADGAAVWSL